MLTILFLASNPTKTGRLRLDKECREIKEKIKLSENSKQFNFISEWAVRIKNLLDFVTEKNPDVIHFSGHGDDSDIILEGEDGNPVTVSKSAIIRLLGRCKNLKLVVFNTCYSVSFAQEAVKKVNFAVGMNGSINEDSVIAFEYRLYSSLGTGRSIEDSYEDALTEIELNSLSGVDIPQLHIKDGIDKHIPLVKKEDHENNKENTIINVKGNYGQINTASGNSFMNVTQNIDKGFDKKNQITQNNFPNIIKKEIAIIIDGPNLINRIVDLGINKQYIINQFSLASLKICINQKIKELGYEYSCNIVEFICSQKVFGSGNNRFSQDERNSLINRLKREKGVHIEEIKLPGTSEKGVDITVAHRLQDFANQDEIAVLISADRDYVPILDKLRKERKKVITVSFNDEFPIEIQNESYETIALKNEYRGLFLYNYPKYNVKTITFDEFKDLFANADDRRNNQLRVHKSGDIFISHEYSGAENILCLQFRGETYVAYNGYVGPKAASDDGYMQDEYEVLKKDWDTGRKGYIDH